MELEAVRLAILSFIKLSLSLSFLFILFKHGRHPEQTFNRNLGSSHRDENTFDSRTYSLSEQSNSRLGFPKLPGQHQIETLANCFKQICSHLEKPLLDLFASGLCNQLPRYIA